MRSYAVQDIVRNLCWSLWVLRTQPPGFHLERCAAGLQRTGCRLHIWTAWLLSSAACSDCVLPELVCLKGTDWNPIGWCRVKGGGGEYLAGTLRYRWSTGTPWSKAGLADYSRKKRLSSYGFCVAKSRIFKGNARVTLQSSHHIGYFVVRQKIKEWKWSIVRHTYQRSGISTSGRRSPPPFPRWRLWVGSGVSVQIVPRWRPGAAGWRSRNCRDRPGRGVPAGWGREAGWQEPDIVARSWGLAPPRPLQQRRTWAEPTAWGDPGVTLVAAVVVVVAAAQTLCPQPRPVTLHPASPRISARDLVREVEAEKWWSQRRCAASVLTCFIAICTDTNLREHPGLQMIPSEYFCLLLFCCMSKLIAIFYQHTSAAGHLVNLPIWCVPVLRAQTVTSKQRFTHNEFNAKNSRSWLNLSKLEVGPCRRDCLHRPAATLAHR